MIERRRAKRKPGKNIGITFEGGMGYQMPPDMSCILIYFQQKDQPDSEADLFYAHYQKLKWKTATGKPFRNWKVLATDWIYERRQAKELRQRVWVNRSIIM